MNDVAKTKYSLVQLRELKDAAGAGGFSDELEARLRVMRSRATTSA